MTTNVNENTKLKDILKGNYESVVDDGTPEYLCIDDEKYKYIDYKYAMKIGYVFVSTDSHSVFPYKSKIEDSVEHLMKTIFYE